MYESHITVEGVDSHCFLSTCREFKLKPVLIEGDTGSDYPQQMMTARFHKTKNQTVAMTEMESIAKIFGQHVIRRKLELILGKKSPPAERLYLEFHSKYEMQTLDSGMFEAMVLHLGGHTSRNVWKNPNDKNMCYRFLTTRDRDLHREIIGKLAQDYRLVNTIAECVVFDDNPTLDSHWHCFDCPIKEIMRW